MRNIAASLRAGRIGRPAIQLIVAASLVVFGWLLFSIPASNDFAHDCMGNDASLGEEREQQLEPNVKRDRITPASPGCRAAIYAIGHNGVRVEGAWIKLAVEDIHLDGYIESEGSPLWFDGLPHGSVATVTVLVSGFFPWQSSFTLDSEVSEAVVECDGAEPRCILVLDSIHGFAISGVTTKATVPSSGDALSLSYWQWSIGSSDEHGRICLGNVVIDSRMELTKHGYRPATVVFSSSDNFIEAYMDPAIDLRVQLQYESGLPVTGCVIRMKPKERTAEHPRLLRSLSAGASEDIWGKCDDSGATKIIGIVPGIEYEVWCCFGGTTTRILAGSCEVPYQGDSDCERVFVIPDSCLVTGLIIRNGTSCQGRVQWKGAFGQGSAVTDKHGRFVMEHVVPGLIDIEAVAFRPRTTSNSQVTVPNGGHTDIVISMEVDTTVIEGLVSRRSPDGYLEDEDLTVVAELPGSGWRWVGRCSHDGRFRVPIPSVGAKYTVTVSLGNEKVSQFGVMGGDSVVFEVE